MEPQGDFSTGTIQIYQQRFRLDMTQKGPNGLTDRILKVQQDASVSSHRIMALIYRRH